MEDLGYKTEKYLRELSSIDPRLSDIASDYMIGQGKSLEQTKRHFLSMMQKVQSAGKGK